MSRHPRVIHHPAPLARPLTCACGQPLTGGDCRACAEHLERQFEEAVSQALGSGAWAQWEAEAQSEEWEGQDETI